MLGLRVMLMVVDIESTTIDLFSIVIKIRKGTLMLVRMMGPTGSIEKVRDEDEQHYIDLGYTHVAEPETVELMSPAGREIGRASCRERV